MLKLRPGAPELVKVTVAAPDGVIVSVVPSLALVSGVAVLMTVTTWPLVPRTL